MSEFRLSKRSWGRMEGVDSRLVATAKRAIKRSVYDFGVTSGLRSEAEQRLLFNRKASQCDGVTKRSKHQDGNAIDIAVYIGARCSWEHNLYDDCIDAFLSSAREIGGIGLRWGGAWHIDDMLKYEGTCENAQMEYIDLRRSQGRRPFLDSVHIECFDYDE